MSRSDYEKPAWYQINKIYECQQCGDKQEIPLNMMAQMPCPCCGGWVTRVGGSYPGNANDWDMERDNINAPWRYKK